MNKYNFINELSKLRPQSTFMSICGYRNEHSEVADYSIIFHMSYANALRRSVMALESIVPVDDMQAIAKRELIDGYNHSLEKMATTPVEEIDDAYTRFFDNDGSYIKGVKVHTATNTLHLYGLINFKRVIMPGTYPKSNKRELTLAKDKLRKLCPVAKFRQFRILPSQVDSIAVQNLSLLPPQE